MMKLFHIVVFLLFFSIVVKGQFVDNGADPSRLRWKSVRTPHYQVIYPERNDSMAYRYALFLERAYPHMGKTIGRSEYRSFPVVLHPENMLSNGLVAWAPRRMDLITTPQAKLAAQSWDKHLVLHESRHVQQMYKFSQGLFKPFNYILGEQTIGFATFVVPKWFFEGDAVATETAMSNSGRGRQPEFTMDYRARMLSGRFYSYDKWALGSYKDYTGDYYALGYNLTAYARYAYGEDIWDRVTSRYTRRFFRIPPFSKALKEYTGLSTTGLFAETYGFLNEEWKRQDSLYQRSGFAGIIDYMTPATERYTAYQYPQIPDDTSVIAVKTNLDDLNSLVMIRNGVEKRLCYLGNINSRIVLHSNRVYWTEYVPGLRWAHENDSELKYYDLNSGKIITVTHGRRFLAPAIDPAGTIAAVSQPDVCGVNKIVLMDVADWKEIKHFDTPANGFVKEVVFSAPDEVAAIVIDDRGLALFRLNIVSGRWDELMAPTSANISSLSAGNGRLFFESGADGTNNIYCYEPSTSETFRLTTSRFGAFSPALSADGKKLFFSDYDANGYRLAAVPVDSLQKQAADFGTVYDPPLAKTIAEQEVFNLDTDSLEAIPFDPKPYRKGARLFNAHSWAPFYYDAIDIVNSQADDLSTIVKPGCMLLSQNRLNTMITQLGWYYDDGDHHGKVSFAYKGWFPVVDVSLDYGGKTFDAEWQKNEKDEEGLFFQRTGRKLLDLEAAVYVPFNLTRNHYVSGFQPILTYSFTNNRYQQYESRKFREYQYLLGEIVYYKYRKMARREILPRLGYQLRLQYLTVPFDTENFGSLYAARLTTYLPGLIRGHGLMLRAMYQYQELNGKTLYIPQKLVSQARGYRYNYQTRQQVELKADYSFSLFCPDVSIKGLAYVKRFRSNVFYDLSVNQVKKRSDWTTISSVGADFIADCNLLRLSYPMSVGVRIIKPMDYGNIQAEGLFSVSF